ncbi:MAG: hypothetical protein HQ541_22340 [Mariniphaga sp.]|nr:hypothetical protein [Mariniphaga sp.]
MKSLKSSVIFFLLILLGISAYSQGYKNFKVAVYCRAYEVEKMNDLESLTALWDELSKQAHVDKIYLETHRDLLIVEEETLKTAIKFFKDRGVEVGGGITYTIDESNNFQTFCYSNPEDRKKVQEIAEHTAKFFDEFILDDFFFTSCKCDLCIDAKGDKSWTDYRLELMQEAAINLVIKPAKAVNPNTEVVIKYPNWYEHFQGLGFNLEEEPAIFDGLYTGTETRNRSGNQHLQQYLSYNIIRYFENLKPGENRGGWVDTGGGTPYDRYAEQLWLTLFAKAPEITLFDIRQMQGNLNPRGKAPWNAPENSFDFDEMMKPVKLEDGSEFTPTKMIRAAGYSFEVIDKVLGELGNPIGIKSYKPYHSVGEDFLQNYIGMIGIPMDMVPEFPEDEEMVFLTETASFDPQIVDKIRKQLRRGKQVVVTSGFYKAMQDKGIEDIVELRVTDRKASVKEFSAGFRGGRGAPMEKEIIIPQIHYLTNDSWEVVSALDDTNGWPILHRADYSTGQFMVLTIPDNFVDLYILPENVLNRLRQNIAGSLPISLEGPSEVSLMVYDNNSCVVESFLDEEVAVRVMLKEEAKEITNIETGEKIPVTVRKASEFRGRKFGNDAFFVDVKIKPHSFKAFKF